MHWGWESILIIKQRAKSWKQRSICFFSSWVAFVRIRSLKKRHKNRKGATYLAVRDLWLYLGTQDNSSKNFLWSVHVLSSALLSPPAVTHCVSENASPGSLRLFLWPMWYWSRFWSPGMVQAAWTTQEVYHVFPEGDGGRLAFFPVYKIVVSVSLFNGPAKVK